MLRLRSRAFFRWANEATLEPISARQGRRPAAFSPAEGKTNKPQTKYRDDTGFVRFGYEIEFKPGNIDLRSAERIVIEIDDRRKAVGSGWEFYNCCRATTFDFNELKAELCKGQPGREVSVSSPLVLCHS